MGPKYKAKKFIAYFLNYTNTYAPPEDFRSWVEEAMAHPDVVGVDVSTRPDCVNERYLEILKESSEKYGKDVTVELGLQSSNAHTLLKLGRCHTAAEYVDAALRIGRYGFDQCTHVIADLPWDDRVDVIETAKLISVSWHIFGKTSLSSGSSEGRLAAIRLRSTAALPGGRSRAGSTSFWKKEISRRAVFAII